jgi:hypothetical protein
MEGKSPRVPKGSTTDHHSISSPPPPPVYHKAMIAYHQYTLERTKNKDLDFLAYWFAESQRQGDNTPNPSPAEDSTADILSSIEIFRNKVVEQCRGKYISLLAVRGIVFDLQRDAAFPESKEYWTSVLESLQHQPSSSVPISDLSEAVISFLRAIEQTSSGESSVQPGDSSSSLSEELEALKTYVNTSIRDIRMEMRRESQKLKSAVTTAATSRNASTKASPVAALSLPIESRQQETITGSRSSRRSWCASCADDVCLMQ